MKKIFILTAFVLSTAIGSTAYAQQAPPPGSGDKNLGDNSIKTRSVEMERVERDAKKSGNNPAANAAVTAEDRLAVKYADIKTDYEQIQVSQDAIVKTYQGAGKIDYAQIGKFALEINTSAMRLNANLFPVPTVEEVEEKNIAKKVEIPEKAEKVAKPVKNVRDLIIELDAAIGNFATSPMFQNLRVVDAAVSAKAKLDLEKITQLSAALDAEARKVNSAGK